MKGQLEFVLKCVFALFALSLLLYRDLSLMRYTIPVIIFAYIATILWAK